MPPAALPVTRLTWSAAGSRSVVFYRVEGGGHTCPASRSTFPAASSDRSRTISTQQASCSTLQSKTVQENPCASLS